MPDENKKVDGRQQSQRLKFKRLICLIEPYLDALCILKLRQANRYLYTRSFKPHKGVLLYRALSNICMDANLLCKDLIPLSCSAIHTHNRRSLTIDLSGCVSVRDKSVAWICENLHGGNKGSIGNLRCLNLDFCTKITDDSLEILLTTQLPYMESISFNCARNRDLTGRPFLEHLSSTTWPQFKYLSCKFTNLTYDVLHHIADFLKLRWGSESYSLFVIGAIGTKCLFDRLGLTSLIKSFSNALINDRSLKDVSSLTKLAQMQVHTIASSSEWQSNAFVQVIKDMGAELLVNCPMISPNTDSVKIWTLPFTVALKWDDIHVLRLLLKRNVHVNVPDFLGHSLLSQTCHTNRLDFMDLLISNGALPNPMNNDSVLDVALSLKNPDMIQLLLKYGAKSNHRTSSWHTHQSNSLPIYKRLLEDPNLSMLNISQIVFEKLGHVPIESPINDLSSSLPRMRISLLSDLLIAAIRNCDADLTDLLVKKCPHVCKIPHKRWSFPHIYAARLGHSELMTFILEFGADINAKTQETESTGLHFASEGGHVSCVRQLLQLSADLNSQDIHGYTPLHKACLENKVETVELLLSYMPDVNIRSKSGDTCIMSSLRARHYTPASLVLSSGVDVDLELRDRSGRTILFHAIYFRQFGIGLELVKKGSDLWASDNFGVTPYKLASERLSCPNTDRGMLKKIMGAVSKCPNKHVSQGVNAVGRLSSDGSSGLSEIPVENKEDKMQGYMVNGEIPSSGDDVFTESPCSNNYGTVSHMGHGIRTNTGIQKRDPGCVNILRRGLLTKRKNGTSKPESGKRTVAVSEMDVLSIEPMKKRGAFAHGLGKLLWARKQNRVQEVGSL